jgi:hypothetical protein
MPRWVPYVIAFGLAGWLIVGHPDYAPYVVATGFASVIAGWVAAALLDEWRNR